MGEQKLVVVVNSTGYTLRDTKMEKEESEEKDQDHYKIVVIDVGWSQVGGTVRTGGEPGLWRKLPPEPGQQPLSL